MFTFSNFVRAATRTAGSRAFNTRGMIHGNQKRFDISSETIPGLAYENQTCGGVPMLDAMKQFTKLLFDPAWLYKGVTSLHLTQTPGAARDLGGIPARTKKYLSELELAEHLAETGASVKAGSPTTRDKKVADKWATSLLDRLTLGWLSQGAVLVVDKNGVSDENITTWTEADLAYANALRQSGTAPDRASLPIEHEVTLHNIAGWNIPFAEVKKYGKVSIIANPMYIDILALSEDLKKEYVEINSKFHDECLNFKTTGKPVPKEFQEAVGSFYAKVCLETGTSLDQMKDIMTELSTGSVPAFKQTYNKEFQKLANPSIANDKEKLQKEVNDFDPQKASSTRSQGFFKDEPKDAEDTQKRDEDYHRYLDY